MTAITFDTLKFVKKLESAGAAPELAEALVEAQREALQEAIETRQLATKNDLTEMENRLIKWSVGLALGQTAIIAALVKLL